MTTESRDILSFRWEVFPESGLYQVVRAYDPATHTIHIGWEMEPRDIVERLEEWADFADACDSQATTVMQPSAVKRVADDLREAIATIKQYRALAGAVEAEAALSSVSA